jgi:hypothetical protein
MQLTGFVPPRHWCERFACDAQTFLDAALSTDFKTELLNALTLAATRHPDAEWLSLLAGTWLSSGRDFTELVEAVPALVNAAKVTERDALMQSLVAACQPEQFGAVSQVLESLDLPWSAALTAAAFEKLERVVVGDTTQYAQNRNALDAWARRCDVAEGGRRGAALAERCGETHRWRNALDQFNEIVAFRAAMQEELRP